MAANRGVIPPIPALREAGCPIALGTDNNTNDVFEVMRIALLTERGFSTPQVATFWAVVGVGAALYGPAKYGTLPELVDFLKSKEIAKFKLPERLETLAEFPVSTFGKVSKKKLSEMAAERAIARGQKVRA